MMTLVSVIVLVAVLVGPAGAATVYQNDDPTYPVFEVNAQTEAHPPTTWSEQATEWLAHLAAKFGVSNTQQATQGTPLSISF